MNTEKGKLEASHNEAFYCSQKASRHKWIKINMQNKIFYKSIIESLDIINDKQTVKQA